MSINDIDLEPILYKPIGIIHTPFKGQGGVPFQPWMGKDIEGVIELDPKFKDGLKDLEGFSHIYVLFHMHLIKDYHLRVTPAWDSKEHGLFTTRSPRRPNPIGLSLVRIKRVIFDEAKIEIIDVDMIDESPLIDIKPYIPFFNPPEEHVRVGWFETCKDRILKKMSKE